MDLHRRKLLGDRAMWFAVLLATTYIVWLWLDRRSSFLFYVLIGWSLVVVWLAGFSELRVGRAQPEAKEGTLHRGWATFVGEERLDVAGSRTRTWSGTVPGVMDFEPGGVRWAPKHEDDDEAGPIRVAWDDLFAFRLIGVLPLIARASGYLALRLADGRELVFHVHGVRAWRWALREAVIVGPTHGVSEPAQAAPPPLVAAAVAGPPLVGTEPPRPVRTIDPSGPPTLEMDLSELEDDDHDPWRPPRMPAPPTPAPPPPPPTVPEPEPAPPPSPRESYEAVIGLECHVELSTASKIFCGCPTAFGAPPNTQICPVCTGQPGSLPVLNQRAVEYALLIAIALDGRVEPRSIFHRKNYFYPDMPKNYQISQYDLPLSTGGSLQVEVDGEARAIRIHRVHLEEDTGKTTHGGEGGRIAEGEYALVDYNRAGIPLVEIVSEPDIRTPDEARAYLTELRALLAAIGVSDVRMEEGSLRCDANVSVRKRGETELGTKTEVKNMNSIRSVARALTYEIERQIDVLESGGRIVQETRHFDEGSGRTSSMRTKEFAFDYRYFADPDLVPLEPDDTWIDEVRSKLPELPAARRRRFEREHGLGEADVRALTASRGLADAFEEAARLYGGEGRAIARWYLGELAQAANDRGVEAHEVGVSPEAVAQLQRLVDDGRVTISLAKGEVLRTVMETGAAPSEVVDRAGLAQISDASQLAAIVDQVITEHPDVVEQIRGGKGGAVNALIGQVMKATRGQANAATVKVLLDERLNAGGPAGQPR